MTNWAKSLPAFLPRRGLRSGHLQTIAAVLLPRRSPLPAPEPRLFSVEPEAQILALCHWQPQKTRALTLVIVHGLEGSAASRYVVGTAAKAWEAGMNVVRMNVRNCGGSERLAPTLYHSGLSADVGAVLRTLIADDRLPRLALVGFSMGGNQVLKLAGEWGREAPPQLQAVAAVSPGMDLAVSAAALHQWQNRLYELHFLWSLRRRTLRKRALFPDRYANQCLPWMWSIRDFDNTVTAPHWGFSSADDYYCRASASQVIDRIAVPALVLHAKDDPFIRITPATAAKLLANPNVHFLETAYGGHCGFLADANGYDGRWAELAVVQFLRQFA